MGTYHEHLLVGRVLATPLKFEVVCVDADYVVPFEVID